ncbi:MAG: S41 family peptidase [Flavobacteriales bacterium]|nr:S41 family peptidase [Flavobacteriales bacterium]
MKQNKYFRIAFLPVLIAFFLVIGIYLGFLLSQNSGGKTVIFPINQHFKNSNKLYEVMGFIKDMYVDSVNTTELTEKSITSILSNLDPHSYYIPVKEFNDMNDPLEGNFQGIGVEFRIIEDTVMIITVIPGGPSEKAGIEAGDRIVKVENETIAGIGITSEQVIKKLKGPKDTKVKVGIVRKNSLKVMNYTITRGEIPIYSVESPYMIDDNIGFIKINRFAKTTHTEFLKASKALLKEGMESLILDLRGNGGGVMTSATKIADEMLAKNKMIVYTQGRVRKKEEFYSTEKGNLQNIEIVILINESSASASEIIAGAIQDNDRGTIIGRRSFGKGLVQEQVMWPDGSALRLTVARYYTPSGRCIQKPYTEGSEMYNLESYNRFNSGELLTADSIHFEDSLKYYTPSGKVVYGGGGITPDIFVPIDTNGNSNYFYELRMRGILQDFSLHYVDDNRTKLKKQYKNAVEFKQKFFVSNDLFNRLIKFAESKELPRNLNEIKISKELITRTLRATISKDLFGNFGYYVIINDEDNTVQKAVSKLSNKKSQP